MFGIIRLGEGTYYTSAIFACCRGSKAEYDYDKYYIVLNEKKTKLVKQPLFNPEKKPQLELMILFLDGNQDGWYIDDCGYGEVDFLNPGLMLEQIESEELPDEIINQCKIIDSQYSYKEDNEILSDADIKQLMLLSGGFHDAVIEEIHTQEDGSLYVRYGGIWGCKIEILFEGDISYQTESRNPELYDPYWYGATMIRQDGYIYLMDEEDMKVEDISDESCWFRSRRVKYHVIPD